MISTEMLTYCSLRMDFKYRLVFMSSIFIVFVCVLGQRKSAIYSLWTMCSGVDRNWDGPILGNVINTIFNSIYSSTKLYYSLILISLTSSSKFQVPYDFSINVLFGVI